MRYNRTFITKSSFLTFGSIKRSNITQKGTNQDFELAIRRPKQNWTNLEFLDN